MRPSRKPRFLLMFMLGLCGFFVYSYTSRLDERSALYRANDQLRSQIQAAQEKQQQLRGELAYVRSPDYLDKVAREDLDHAKPGDHVVVIVKEPADGSFGQAVAQAPAAPVKASSTASLHDDNPVWQQWVSLFAGESQITP